MRLDPKSLEKDTRVVVQRRGGVYEEGVVKYCDYPVETGELIIGVKLDLAS